jgi:hypothetical protein
MPPVEFEPTISASARPQTYALDRAAAGISRKCYVKPKHKCVRETKPSIWTVFFFPVCQKKASRWSLAIWMFLCVGHLVETLRPVYISVRPHQNTHPVTISLSLSFSCGYVRCSPIHLLLMLPLRHWAFCRHPFTNGSEPYETTGFNSILELHTLSQLVTLILLLVGVMLNMRVHVY